MVFVGEKKYACETCIKGHRSSNCKHTDRPLFEIKKKGRPVTQCEHCRQLRKTKQVHVKCVCESKDDPVVPSSSKKGLTKLPVSAAFPSGLPEALEASVALQLLSEGSDSEHGSVGSPSCNCKAGESCHCCTPRTAASRGKRPIKGRRMSVRSAEGSTIQHDEDTPQIARPAGLAATAHAKGNRPLLPRPSPQRPSSPTGPVHDPSQAVHPQNSRHHAQSYYSPYGRAYEYTHGSEVVADQSAMRSTVQDSVPATVSPDIPPPSYQGTPSSVGSWFAPPGSNAPLPSLCGCGPNCSCPGCIVHRGPTSDQSALAACRNPGSCNACFDCGIFDLSSPMPSSYTQMPQYDPSQSQSIDDWLRQLSAPDASGSTHSAGTVSSDQYTFPNSPSRFDPSVWQTYALWNDLQGQTSTQLPSECCGNGCTCPSGMCTCNNNASDKVLTFAVSGERASCCSQNQSTVAFASTSQSFTQSPGGDLGRSAQAHGRNAFDVWGSTATLIPPRTTVSRASSTSSRSSSGHSRTSSRSTHSAPASAAVISNAVPAYQDSMQAMAASSQPNIPMTSTFDPPSFIPPNSSPRHPSSSVSNIQTQHRTLNQYDTNFSSMF